MAVEVHVGWVGLRRNGELDRWLRGHVKRVAGLCGVRRGWISVVLASDAVMRQLHRRYLGSGRRTDVLSFDLREKNRRGVLEAELILGLEQARRAAREYGHEVRLELLLYAVHGLLHLMGYDDQQAEAARRMHQREDRILRQLGLPAAFYKEGTKRVAGRQRRRARKGGV